jgi:RNA polymerase sigma-70 factor (ECF subfamily)
MEDKMRVPEVDRFALHVEPHLEALFRMAWRLLRNTPDAQDLVQDTCLIACGRLAEVATTDSPRRWLLSVLHHRFIDGVRRRQRSPIVPAEETDEVASLASEDFDPEELLQQSQDEHALEQAFLQLNATQRTLLSLLAEGYKLPEIESITGIDRRVLSARLSRARTALSQRLLEQKRMPASNRHAGSQP